MTANQLKQLWDIYLAASVAYEQLLTNWRYVASVARADGTAGQLYAQLFTAEKAKDQAYNNWAKVYAQVAGSHSYAPAYGADIGSSS